MGLFFRKKTEEVSNEERFAREENRMKLEEFQMTKALGVKKYEAAMQFIYDEEARRFVVVEGPAETFRERNPWVIDYDQVEDVWLEVEEYWTESGDAYAIKGFGRLLAEDYSKVYWRYNFFLNIQTSHPYAKTIRFQMNYKTNVFRLPSFNIFIHRGLELNGKIPCDKIPQQVERLEKFAVDCDKAIRSGKVLDTLRGTRPDGFFEKLLKDGKEAYYVGRIENVCKHLKRAEKIHHILLD